MAPFLALAQAEKYFEGSSLAISTEIQTVWASLSTASEITSPVRVGMREIRQTPAFFDCPLAWVTGYFRLKAGVVRGLEDGVVWVSVRVRREHPERVAHFIILGSFWPMPVVGCTPRAFSRPMMGLEPTGGGVAPGRPCPTPFSGRDLWGGGLWLPLR